MIHQLSMMGFLGWLMVAISGLGLTSVAAAEPVAEPPVALVLKVNGSAVLVTAAGEPPLAPLARLTRGAVVRTGSGAEVVLVFVGGQRFRVGPATLAAIGDGAVSTSSGVVAALPPVPAVVELWPLLAEPGAIEGAAAARIRASEGRGGLELAPARGALVDADDLTLHFAAVPAAEGYRLRLEDAASGELLLATEVAGTEVRVPPAGVPAGRTIYWEVEALAESRRLAREGTVFRTLQPSVRAARSALAAQAGAEPELGILLAAVDRTLVSHAER